MNQQQDKQDFHYFKPVNLGTFKLLELDKLDTFQILGTFNLLELGKLDTFQILDKFSIIFLVDK